MALHLISRCSVPLSVLLAAAAFVPLSYGQNSSPGAPPAEPERQSRIDEIEKMLRDLLKEVEGLRAPPPPPQAAKVETPAQEFDGVVPPDWLKSFTWRAIGPANMGGRIVDIAVCESDPSTFWAATASGGLLKTSNNGITFEHQFDKEATVSIGAVAVARSDSKIVWVGTGENNPRNSASYGDGVYKSTDGGKTWKNMGLKKSFQIGRIVIHPKDPNVVYVGALGRLYGPNEERGVFKTTNGGESWDRALFANADTGAIDLAMHPTDPETLIAATWELRRDGFDSWPGTQVPRAEGHDQYDPIKKWGPGTGLHKTTDGGKTWKKLTKGLPAANLGRIGLDWYRRDPNIVFAIVDCEAIGKGPEPLPVYLGAVAEDVDGKARLTQVIPDSPAAKAGLQAGDLVAAVGEKPTASFDDILGHLRGSRPGQKVALKVARGEQTLTIEATLASRPGSGRGIGAGPGGVWLGVTGEAREGKVELTEVVPEGPAAKAGLASGDIIVEVDGKAVSDFDDLVSEIRGRQARDRVNLRVARGRETKDFAVELEERPGSGAGGGRGGRQAPASVYLGLQGEDAEGGVKLTQITDEGPAEKAGLQEGDIVQAIDGKKVAAYDEVIERIRASKEGDKLALSILRGAETKEVAVTVENRPGGPSRTRPYSFSLGGQSPNVQDQQGSKGFEFGGVYRSADGGESWTRVNSLNSRPMYFSHIRVDPSDEKYVYVLGVSQYRSSNGGWTFDGDFGRGVHADGHSLWIDPRDGRHMIIGSDGGTYVTYDRGGSWDHLNQTAIGQFYHVAISPKHPYAVTGGLQDNGTWAGPSLSLRGGGPINEDWISVSGGDGFQCQVDPDEPDLIYFTSQDGNLGRRNLRTGERAAIRPARPRGAPPYRFNWNTPFILSKHNPRIYYCAGNFVFRSLDRGNNLQAISPEITLTKRGSATALAESPRDPNVLYAGTDDGALWVTRDGGKEWTDVSKNFGLPQPRWVSTVETSRFETGRVYAALDGHRSDDDDPYLYASEDFGKTWQPIRSNLPWGSTRCLREDVRNQNLLFAGTDFGGWFSINRGKSWNKLNTNLPTVAVHEFALHPTNGEIVAATHGRSLWITDISALRQIAPENLKDKIALFKPSTAIRWQGEPTRGGTNRRFVGTNPPSGAGIYYMLPKKAGRVTLRILDVEGTTVRELRGLSEPGLHRLTWDLASAPAGARGSARGLRGGRGRGAPPAAQEASAAAPGQPATPAATEPQGAATTAQAGAAPSTGRASAQRPPSGRGGGFGGFGGFGGGRRVPAGTYKLVLNVDGEEFNQTIRVETDPNIPPALAAEQEAQGWDFAPGSEPSRIIDD